MVYKHVRLQRRLANQRGACQDGSRGSLTDLDSIPANCFRGTDCADSVESGLNRTNIRRFHRGQDNFHKGQDNRTNYPNGTRTAELTQHPQPLHQPISPISPHNKHSRAKAHCPILLHPRPRANPEAWVLKQFFIEENRVAHTGSLRCELSNNRRTSQTPSLRQAVIASAKRAHKR